MGNIPFSGRIPVSVNIFLQAGRGKVVLSSGELQTYFYVSFLEAELLKFYKKEKAYSSLDPFEKDTAGINGVSGFFIRAYQDLTGVNFTSLRVCHDEKREMHAMLINDAGNSFKIGVLAGIMIAFFLDIEIVVDRELLENPVPEERLRKRTIDL